MSQSTQNHSKFSSSFSKPSPMSQSTPPEHSTPSKPSCLLSLHCRLRGHVEDVVTLQVVNDNEILISGCRSGTIRIWHLQSTLCCSVVDAPQEKDVVHEDFRDHDESNETQFSGASTDFISGLGSDACSAQMRTCLVNQSTKRLFVVFTGSIDVWELDNEHELKSTSRHYANLAHTGYDILSETIQNVATMQGHGSQYTVSSHSSTASGISERKEQLNRTINQWIWEHQWNFLDLKERQNFIISMIIRRIFPKVPQDRIAKFLPQTATPSSRLIAQAEAQKPKDGTQPILQHQGTSIASPDGGDAKSQKAKQPSDKPSQKPKTLQTQKSKNKLNPLHLISSKKSKKKQKNIDNFSKI